MDELERAILSSMTTPLLAVQGSGRIRYVNPAAEDFFRLPPGSPARIGLAQVFGEGSTLWVQVRRAIAEQKSVTIDSFRYDPGRGQAPLVLRVQIDPVSLAPGDTALVLFWDQTHLEHLESTTHEQRVMGAIGTIIKRLAHEVHNPLSGIKGATQLLERQVRNAPDLAECAAVILKELDRMERLVKSLLLQGSEPPLSKTLFNLHELLDTVIWFQNNAATGVDFARDFDPSLPELHGDRDRLHQVFLNLIRNAAQASPPGGTVTLRTRVVGPWQERPELRDPTRTYFQIEIEDQGRGVAQEHIERLFTPFFTTKSGGTGLGLSLSYQIVRSHQGHLRYRDAAAGGAVFVVTLPMA
jgi:two-component system nitrogen regulation sensor histidine kinase GlnL